MKRFIYFFFFSISVFAQNVNNDKIKYFDENYNKISENQYLRKVELGVTLGVVGDSINHRVIVQRENHGKIQNKKFLDSILSLAINSKIDSNKIQTIIFYPGKDSCNSSGSATPKQIKNWHEVLVKRLNKITGVNPIYLYKNEEGLDKNRYLLTWYKDPDGIVEKLFFKYHYPCSSFVVISPEGDYISYFGEFPKEYVWDAAKMLAKKK